MLKKTLRGIFTVIGLVLGYIVSYAILKIPTVKEVSFLSTAVGQVLSTIFMMLIFGIILFLISPYIYKAISNLIEYAEKNIQKLSATEILYAAVGIIVAVVIISLIAYPIKKISQLFGEDLGAAIGSIIVLLLNLVAAIIGADVFMKKKDDISSLLGNIKRGQSKDKKNKGSLKTIAKILDTSVIIDGRIFDICKTGFVEGPLVIPSFVLDELRHISDSSDSLKRNRGRRGLDILNKIQKELEIETQIWEGDFPEIAEVDSKLLKLAQVLKGKVVTNDFNLNKVAEFQGVPVLNINELANAIKPVVLPGEEMKVLVVKDGKEPTQGVAYLDDGTMIVVEDGRRFMGSPLDVIVTSVLQTAAGRMIFAKVKE
ncbi:MAG: PIN/TRAM domain-containing protein [Clostridium sp.]